MSENKSSKLPQGISLRKDGQYQARYTHNGRRYTIYDRSLKGVQKKLRDAKYEIDHGIFAKPDRMTVNMWFETWMKEYQSNVIRETTEVLYRSMYKHHIKDSIGSMKLQAVRPEHIQAQINQMKRDGYSPSFIKRFKNVISKMFKQAYQNDLVVRNPVEKTTTPKEEKHDGGSHRGLSEKEQVDFLRYADELEPQYADLFYLGFSTGMRIGELFALEWSEVDFTNQEVHVNGTMIKLDGKEYRKGLAKTDSSKRSIPLLPEIARRLRKHKIKQARVSRGLSMIELSELIGVCKQAVSQYEMGKNSPSKSILNLIASTLKYPVSFFYKPMPTYENASSAVFLEVERLQKLRH